MRAVGILALLALAALAGAAGYRSLHYHPRYPDQRAPFVLNLAEQFGDADTLIIGDSLTEQTDFSGACGRTFAAGIGGARAPEIPASRLLELTSPETVVVEVGTNYFTTGDGLADLQSDLPALLDILAGRRIILVAPGNSTAAEAYVENLTAERGLQFVAMPSEPELLGPDGLHHNAQGSRALRDAVAEACQA